jgi:acylpyruvate hydrolase
MKIICIGRNYVAHANELNNEVPSSPIFFLKPDTALVTGNGPFPYPDFSGDVHYELEVVLRIGKDGKNITEEQAGAYFDEMGLGVDFTARDLQNRMKEKGLPWEIAKAFDHSAPVGSFYKVSGFRDIHRLEFRLDLNGKTVQVGNTSLMIFSFEKIISYVSKYISFRAGDLVFTGTPAGVGPVAVGDRLEAFLEGEKVMDFSVK